MTSFEEFLALTGQGNVVPVVERMRADTETPISVYQSLRTLSPYSVLLESVEGGEQLARYSFLGVDPFMKFTVTGHRFAIETFHDDVHVLPTLVNQNDAPLEALKKLFAHIRAVRVPGLPRLTGGAIGYFGYESAGLVERVPAPPGDDLHIPDAVLLFFDTMLVFDNVRHEIVLVSNAYLPGGGGESSARKEYDKAVSEIARLKTVLHGSRNRTPSGQPSAIGEPLSDQSEESYCRLVERAREYIAAGDVFQVVLSRRVRQKVQADAFDMYRNLRTLNPSPYMYFLHLKDMTVIGSSPEMLVRVENGIVQTRPIAGTRGRGATESEDSALALELINDPKERAEHLMLVDLGRNDLGRISRYGSVEVTRFMEVERYSHVMHLVSQITGQLKPDLTAIDALFACFPAGTLTGAPKIRAMEIIAGCEPARRGVYGGAIAYIDFAGNLDSCIAIRTILARGETVYFQAGAGIVHDSVPQREYQETTEKLRATLQAVEMLKP